MRKNVVLENHDRYIETMNSTDLQELREAVELLENPGWIANLTNLIGVPLESAISRLPRRIKVRITGAVTKSIRVALEIAVKTMDQTKEVSVSNWIHRAAVGGTGALGGFFGPWALTLELPISTAIMLRSIAFIARSHGEDLTVPESKLACIEVFALGSSSSSHGSLDASYYGVRIGLARALSEAAEYIAAKGLADEGAPVIARLIARIAARFEVVVTEKVAVEIVPVVGAVTGATINVLFINLFQKMAEGHFTIRELERKYGPEEVKKQYYKLRQDAD
ncbi:MAG TPA: EcsC family protein [Candidatus Kryptonia bacterium]